MTNDAWTFQYEGFVYVIPHRMREGIELYVNNGIRPGSFLQAVFCNMLIESVARGDGENIRNLPAYTNYLYNYAPPGCYGSVKAMEGWIKKKVEERKGVDRDAPVS
jgi:hypothetical protein